MADETRTIPVDPVDDAGAAPDPAQRTDRAFLRVVAHLPL